MRVVHVDSAREWRGSQSQVLLAAQGMAARGHSVTVACQAGGRLEARTRAAGLAVRPLVFGGDLAPTAILGLARLLRAEAPHVVHHGVLDRRPEREGREALAELGIPAGGPVIGNVAALTEHKDHATLLAAMPRVLRIVPAARLVIVGAGELRGRLESEARTLGLGERCVFTGFRSGGSGRPAPQRGAPGGPGPGGASPLRGGVHRRADGRRDATLVRTAAKALRGAGAFGRRVDGRQERMPDESRGNSRSGAGRGRAVAFGAGAASTA